MTHPPDSGTVEIVRLVSERVDVARATFELLVAVFDEPGCPLGDAYLTELLQNDAFWAYAATVDGRPVGGITAHTMGMTRSESREIFIYDLAVAEPHQRRGVGRALVDRLRHDAATVGIDDVIVPADDDDQHALDFYRAIGGTPSPVTLFHFGPPTS